MSELFISYVDLSPDLDNRFVDRTHHTLLGRLREHLSEWDGFAKKHQSSDLGFIIVTEQGSRDVRVKGPTVFRDAVDFSIFIPDSIFELDPTQVGDVLQYITWVFSGISEALANYAVEEQIIERVKTECILDLGMSDMVH